VNELQDELNNKSVALSVKAAKMTGRLLAKAMQAFLKKAREPTYKHGVQSVKSLTKQGAGLTNIEIGGDNIGDFKRIARKYNVDFALKRDDSETPPKWLVFFKAKDADALTAAFKEYSKVTLKVKERPNFLEKLYKFKQKAKELAAPVKHREKGGHEL
jgi:hypothetical protein